MQEIDNKAQEAQEPKEKVKDNEITSQDWEKLIARYKWHLIIAGIVILVFFMANQHYDLSEPIDSGIWGTYGDFIGGVLGTIVAYISLRFLILTLKEQKEANITICENNERNSKVYELQQFEGTFQTMLSLYLDAVNSYKKDGYNSGRDSMRAILEDVYIRYKNNGQYASKVRTAVRCFDELYVENRQVMSVHFRVLYQLCRFISKAKIDDNKKALYSKIVRSQLSEEECIMIRYNCLNSYGLKMQDYANEFNLLKHLPFTRLMEFKAWDKIFSDSYKKNILDTEFIGIRKRIRILFRTYDDQEKTESIKYSRRYVLIITVSADRKHMGIELKRINKTKNIKSIEKFEKAFDILTDNEIRQMLISFIYEIVYYSNFGKFNKKEDLTYEFPPVKSDGIVSSICVSVTKSSPLIMSYQKVPRMEQLKPRQLQNG